MELAISDAVVEKIESEHQVPQATARTCFDIYDVSEEKTLVLDSRPEHLTDPVTEWIVVRFSGRLIALFFMIVEDEYGELAVLKSAHPLKSNDEKLKIYRGKGGKIYE